MARSINRNFQFVGSSKDVRSGQLWYPAADVYQTPEGWVVKVELAGVSPEDIEIDIGKRPVDRRLPKGPLMRRRRVVPTNGDHV